METSHLKGIDVAIIQKTISNHIYDHYTIRPHLTWIKDKNKYISFTISSHYWDDDNIAHISMYSDDCKLGENPIYPFYLKDSPYPQDLIIKLKDMPLCIMSHNKWVTRVSLPNNGSDSHYLIPELDK